MGPSHFSPSAERLTTGLNGRGKGYSSLWARFLFRLLLFPCCLSSSPCSYSLGHRWPLDRTLTVRPRRSFGQFQPCTRQSELFLELPRKLGVRGSSSRVGVLGGREHGTVGANTSEHGAPVCRTDQSTNKQRGQFGEGGGRNSGSSRWFCFLHFFHLTLGLP